MFAHGNVSMHLTTLASHFTFVKNNCFLSSQTLSMALT